MAYQVIWSDEAQNEIRAILTYLMDTWNDKIAENFSRQIGEVAELLTKQPFSGQRNRNISAVRQFPVRPYYMVEYTIITPISTIYILNVVDSRRKK